MYTIKTSTGRGSPGYLEWDKAPAGQQWIVNGEHAKVPEGATVDKTGRRNKDTGFCEIVIKSGGFSGTVVSVKEAHCYQEPTPPPQPQPKWVTVFEITFFGVDWRLQKLEQTPVE